jgi:hypothetical protein
MRVFIACCLALLLTGCLTQEEREARIDGADNDRCIGYGAQPGTSAYTQCRMQLAQMRQQTTVAQTALLGQMIQNNQAVAAQQQAQQQQSLRAVVQPLPPAPTNCLTSYVGNQAYTQCH